MPSSVVGVLLAGGQSRRMGGGDKCLRMLGGETILSRVIARASPQVETLVLNANGDPKRFSSFSLPIAPDVVAGFHGPLAGILTGLEWAAANVAGAQSIVTFPVDAPFFPVDLVSRFEAAVEGLTSCLVCASSAGRTHPVFGLWPLSLAGNLRTALVDDEMRKIDAWTALHDLVEVSFSAEPFDPFFNLNRPDDLAEAERLLDTLT
ncbi:MAG: molybdenum cofactor guanylyltransferase MobA [Alphaproteobacteria bacterium]|nr:molybdenum cofactor guanylyltransferase MobA [Alphaproteobacteria bacterium]